MRSTTGPASARASLERLVSVKLWAVAEALQTRLARDLAALDLTVPAFRLVGEVMRSPEGVRPGELARRLGVRAPTVSAAVSRLEARGIVTRRDDPEDPRAHRVCLASGAPLAAGVDVLARLDADLVDDDAERERLASVLEHLLHRLEPGDSRER